MYYYQVVFFSIVVCIISFWIRWRKRRMNLFQRYGIPGPKPNFFTGNLKEFHEKRSKCFDEWEKKYGNIFGFFLGGKPYIISTDVDFLKTVQVKEFKNFSNKDPVLPDAGIPHKIIFNFLEFQNDEKWKNMRAIISTSFTSGKIKMMSTLMDDPIKIFLKIIEKQDGYFNIFERFKMLTFDITCRAAFGIAANSQTKKTTKFVQTLHSLFSSDTSNTLFMLSICFPEFEPIPTYIRWTLDAIGNMMNFPSIRYVIDACKDIIESRKKSNYHPPDLMQILLDAEGDSDVEMKKLSTDSVISNAIGFIVAGYETTSITLGWCAHLLAHHPDVQDKVRQEINDNIKESEDIRYSDLMNLKYMDQVLSETLRLIPLEPFTINRVCAKDFKYKDVTIPKGVIVMVPFQNLQNDAKYWHDPEKFDPERFAPKNNIDPFVYQPFGAGPRTCIGMRLAQTIMKLTLSNLIRSFKLEPYGDLELKKEYSLFLSYPKDGVTVKAVPLEF